MTAKESEEVRLKGQPVSEGWTVARVCMFNEHRHSNLPMFRVAGQGVERELARFERAAVIVGERLDELQERVRAEIGAAEAGIFHAQREILRDDMIVGQITRQIREEHRNAESAVAAALDAFESRIMALDNEYIKERASDFGEIKRRLLDVFGNMNPALQCTDEEHCQRGRRRIVVAEELTPTLTVELDTENLQGFVTERGGKNSHGAILARAIGIPAVSGLRGIRDRVQCGAELLVNGTTGEVVIWPSEDTVRQVNMSAGPELDQLPQGPVEGFRVMANIRSAADVEEARRAKAEGVGLYRTELEAILAGGLPTEDDLYEKYSSAVKAMGDHGVVFRVFDMGSDKKPVFLDMPYEENPAMGLRGTRLLLQRPDLLRVQARALARASRHGPVDVLYPMIVDRAQFVSIREAFRRAIPDLAVGTLRHGVMFEVPSACLLAGSILAEADFASIGTNDLTQYLFAVDRNNDRVSDDFNSDHPAFWELIERIIKAAKETGKPLAVCGEMGGDPQHIQRLIRMGIRTVSVSTRRIPLARAAAIPVLAKDAAAVVA